jgi:hypothetical protein
MKKPVIIAIILIGAWACSQTEEQKAPVKEVKMAEFSELAMLMKAIHEDAKG